MEMTAKIEGIANKEQKSEKWVFSKTDFNKLT